MRSAHDAQWIYDELGIKLSGLGCIMAKMSAPKINLPEWYLYHAKDKERFWIDGVVKNSHVTLKYGLMEGVTKQHVDRVLEGWELSDVYVKEVMVFNSPFPDEPYKCIVLAMESNSLSDANARLSMLPNVSTFKDYVPHLTVAYVAEEFVDEAVMRIKSQLQAYHPEYIGLDYGNKVK